MPLAVHRRHVSVVAQHGSDRGPAWLDHRIALGSVQHPVLQPVPPCVTTRQQAVAGRRAPGRRRVGVGEADSHVGQALHVRGMKLDLVRIACEVLIRARIAHPHVVGHHEDDVGLFGGGIRAGNRGQSEDHCENGGRSAHNSTTLRNIGQGIADSHSGAFSEEVEEVPWTRRGEALQARQASTLRPPRRRAARRIRTTNSAQVRGGLLDRGTTARFAAMYRSARSSSKAFSETPDQEYRTPPYTSFRCSRKSSIRATHSSGCSSWRKWVVSGTKS